MRTAGFTMATYMPTAPALPPGAVLTIRDIRGKLLQRGVVQKETHPRLTVVAGQQHEETAMTNPPIESGATALLDAPPPLLMGHRDRVVFYRDQSGRWRWRFRAAGNGRVLADSGQGYRRLDDAWAAAERVTARNIEPPGPAGLRIGDLVAVVWR